MAKIYFEIEGDVMVKYTPMPQIGENIYNSEIIMNKDIFVKCYQKWILEKADWIDECGHWICPKCGTEFSDLRSIDGKIQDNYCPSCGQYLNTLAPTESNF